MWIDAAGTAHTVALPDPSAVMSDEFRRSVDALTQDAAAPVSDLLASEEIHFFDSLNHRPTTPGEEAAFVAVAPPSDLLSGRVDTLTELAARIRDVDARWRLDVVLALDDYVT